MKLTQKITLALGVLAAGTSFAQTTASQPAGLLGQRYAELSFGAQDLKQLKPNLYGFGAGVNTPLIPGSFDVGASYDYSWIRGSGLRGSANTFGGYGTFYTAVGGVKPFVGAGVGWEWSRARGFGSGDQGLWGAAVGVEIPVGVLTLTPRLAYGDDFENSKNSTQQFTYGIEANYWVNAKTAVYGGLGFTDVRSSPLESWNYQVGLRLKF